MATTAKTTEALEREEALDEALREVALRYGYDLEGEDGDYVLHSQFEFEFGSREEVRAFLRAADEEDEAAEDVILDH